MNQNLAELIEVSRVYGKNKAFVIAGGGNTSYKDENHIWIKASGAALETIDENGFVSLSREKLKIVSTRIYSEDSVLREAEVKADLSNAIVSTGKNRPSVETSLHEIIDYPFVVHTHPTKVNALMCSLHAAEACSELFGDQALFIPYTDPGYILFKKVKSDIEAYTTKYSKVPQIIFLENHGVFVAADTIIEINQIYADIIQKIDQKIQADLPDNDQKTFESPLIEHIGQLNPGFENYSAKGVISDLIHFFAINYESFLKASTAFTPDDIVYCKAYYLFVPFFNEDQKQIESTKILVSDYQNAYGYLPKVLVLEGKGIIAIEENIKSVLNVLEVYTNILKISFLSEYFGGPKFMNKTQIEFIDNWEVENYRRKMAKS